MLTARVAGLRPSVTLEMAARARELRERGTPVIDLSAGEPDEATPPHICQAAVEAIREGFTRYTPVSGIPELKRAICDKLERENSLWYEPSQVLVSCGAKHALYNILQGLCEPGDEVLIPAPYWVSYPAMVGLAGATSVFVPSRAEDGYKVTVDALAGAHSAHTKVLILNSPSNPTGAVYEREELEAIGEWAVTAGCWVVSDEIYEHLLYDGGSHVSLASLSTAIADRTLTVNGVSKTYAMTGWRIGYVAGPAPVVTALGNLQSHATSNPTSISQRAALAALTGDQGCVRALRATLARRRGVLLNALSGIPGVSWVTPRGAFYVFCDVGAFGVAPELLAMRLLTEAGVAVVPGEDFGSDRAIRLSFTARDELLVEGVQRIGRWLGALTPQGSH